MSVGCLWGSLYLAGFSVGVHLVSVGCPLDVHFGSSQQEGFRLASVGCLSSGPSLEGFPLGCLLGSLHLDGFPLGFRRMSVGCQLVSWAVVYPEGFPWNVRWASVRQRAPGGIAVWGSVGSVCSGDRIAPSRREGEIS